jgi:hypothetical protein
MQGISAVLAEHESILVHGMHTLITDGTIIVWARLALLSTAGSGGGQV